MDLELRTRDTSVEVCSLKNNISYPTLKFFCEKIRI
jgi:hypothetical protein